MLSLALCLLGHVLNQEGPPLLWLDCRSTSSSTLTVAAAAAPLLLPRALWWPLGSPLSSQLLCHGPLSEQQAVQELRSEEKEGRQAFPGICASSPHLVVKMMKCSHAFLAAIDCHMPPAVLDALDLPPRPHSLPSNPSLRDVDGVEVILFCGWVLYHLDS